MSTNIRKEKIQMKTKNNRLAQEHISWCKWMWTSHLRPQTCRDTAITFSSTRSSPAQPSRPTEAFEASPEPRLPLSRSWPRCIRLFHLCVPVVCCIHTILHCTHPHPALHTPPSCTASLDCNLTVQVSAIHFLWTPEGWHLQCLNKSTKKKWKESSSRWQETLCANSWKLLSTPSAPNTVSSPLHTCLIQPSSPPWR